MSELKKQDIFVMAAWFGLLTGLLEGAGLLLFQRLNWLSWDMEMVRVWYPILWVSPLFNLIYFLALGLIVLAVFQVVPGKWRFQSSVFLFAFLMFADWALLTGRIRDSGALAIAAGLAAVFTRWARPREERFLGFARSTWPALAAVAALALATVEGGGWILERRALANLPAAPAGAPNVLFLVMDTVRADHLSSYGYGRETSPRIDAIAKQGVLFERAFSASSWTLPSHASLLTGRFPHEHGATSGAFKGGVPTIGEALIPRGYRTAAFSGNVYFFSRQDGFNRGFHHFEDFFTTYADMAFRTMYGRVFEHYIRRRMGRDDIPARKLASDINGALLRWLDRTPDKPFFAFLNYMDAHDPYLPPQPFRNRFSKSPNPGGRINELVGRYRPKLTAEQLQSEIDAYDGAMAYLDDQIGNLMSEMEKRGLLKNTIVVITSDHGESFGEHGLFTHRNALYRNLIHVPLVLYAPGRVPAGVRVSSPVSNTSLAATLMELLGADPEHRFPGPSLVATWKNPPSPAEIPPPLAELDQMPFPGMRPAPAFFGAMQSLVSPEWQFIHNDKLGAELFDWEKDVPELQNLAATPEGEKIVAEFAARLQQARTARNKPTSLSGSAK